MENWAIIKDFENYAVSDHGRVKRLAGYQARQERIRKPSPIPSGYMQVNLCRDGKHIQRYIHRLVAEAFLGLRPDQQVNHKNGNKHDNRLENLECVTQSENILHAYANGLVSRPKPEDIVRDPISGRILSMLPRKKAA